MPKLPRAANANLAEAHVLPERGAGRKVRSGFQNPGVEPPRPVSALGPPAAAAAPRPQPLSLKRVEVGRGREGWGVRGCIYTKKIPQLGVHAACIKKNTHKDAAQESALKGQDTISLGL